MRKHLLILISAALAASMSACGGANNTGSVGGTPAPAVSSTANVSKAPGGYGGDIGYSNLITALQEQGKIKVKAKYATTKADGSTGSDSVEITWRFYDVALGDVKIGNGSVETDFTALLKNEGAGKYIEEHQRVIATLQSDGAGNYTFTSARIEGNIPIVVKPIVPFSVDLLYESGFVLAYACSNEALEAQRDRILFNDSITVNENTSRTDIENEVMVPMNRENVKNIELLPYRDSETAIKGSDFDLWINFKITLQNNVVIYNAGNIKLLGDKWGFDALRGFNSTATEVENL